MKKDGRWKRKGLRGRETGRGREGDGGGDTVVRGSFSVEMTSEQSLE